MGSKRINPVGEKWKTNEGYIVEITKCDNSKKILIKFEAGNIKTVRYEDLRRGKVSNPYHKSVFGTGFLGEGMYKTSEKVRVKTNAYSSWNNMLKRCYTQEYQEKQPSYIGCSVDERWHNFQNFAEWFEDNYIEGWHLDKDILVKGNKIYSPETCCFVPALINTLFVSNKKTRGNTLIGVYFDQNNGKYTMTCNDGGKGVKKRFKTEKQAFDFYKTFKEKRIKTITEKYKKNISTVVYNTLINYKIEITD